MFCSQYCGWHTYGTYTSPTRVKTTIKYAFIGNPSNCLAACSGQDHGASPNGDQGVDAMISVIAHEIAETVSDPLLNAWYDSSDEENADKCAWTYGTVTTVPVIGTTSYDYNVVIGTSKYLIQQNWVNSGAGFCAKSYP